MPCALEELRKGAYRSRERGGSENEAMAKLTQLVVFFEQHQQELLAAKAVPEDLSLQDLRKGFWLCCTGASPATAQGGAATKARSAAQTESLVVWLKSQINPRAR